MANWVTTIYKIDGDKEQVRKVYEKIKETMSMAKPLVVSDFGVQWIGCLVEAFGESYQKVYCRGRVVEYGLSCGVLTIMVDISESMFCDELLDFFRRQASGCEVYYLTDDACGTRYSNDKDWKYFSVLYPKESVRIV